MAASNRFDWNSKRSFINTKNNAIVIFTFARSSNSTVDKQMFVFNGLFNNVGPFMNLCGFRAYEWSIGTYNYAKWYNIQFNAFIAGNIIPMILIGNANLSDVEIRFDNVPSYSNITCVDSGAFVLKSVQEVT